MFEPRPPQTSYYLYFSGSEIVGCCLFYEILVLCSSLHGLSLSLTQRRLSPAVTLLFFTKGLSEEETFTGPSHRIGVTPLLNECFLCLCLSLFCRYSADKSGVYSWSTELASERTAGPEHIGFQCINYGHKVGRHHFKRISSTLSNLVFAGVPHISGIIGHLSRYQ